jgi:hypothetical protein
MRWAIVIGGVVENIVLWDGSAAWSPEKEAQAVQLTEGQVCGIGWIYDGTTFAEPSE